MIDSLNNQMHAMAQILVGLKQAAPADREALLNEATTTEGTVTLLNMPAGITATTDCASRDQRQTSLPSIPNVVDVPHNFSETQNDGDGDGHSPPDSDFDASHFLSMDGHGRMNAFGPTSALHNPFNASSLTPARRQDIQNQLIANATLQRQREFSLQSWPEIGGVPTELALHLLNIHWNRQHHTFLLTYRPALMRDLVSGGRYCTDFLLNAIFASASKFSTRSELRDNPSDPQTAGARFFRRCSELLIQAPPLEHSSIPTTVGLLLMGSTFLARGETTKSWMYSGLALRMVFDLGLHLNCESAARGPEEDEIRKRVFWGAFICDKLQSLYLGRPFAIGLRDAHVSLDFLDTVEELDLWTPYTDPAAIGPNLPNCPSPKFIHSVSTFQQFCLLSKIMTRIIKNFYFAGARASTAQSILWTLDEGLLSWYTNLPDALAFQPWSENLSISQKQVPPNIITLHTTYHSLVILLHRPFMSESHLRSTQPTSNPEGSWKRCTQAASAITSVMRAYRSAYTLRGAPYLASYASYVACTIHVRNASLESGTDPKTWASQKMLQETLEMLDELSVANPCVSGPTEKVRRLMKGNNVPDRRSKCTHANSFFLCHLDCRNCIHRGCVGSKLQRQHKRPANATLTPSCRSTAAK